MIAHPIFTDVNHAWTATPSLYLSGHFFARGSDRRATTNGTRTRGSTLSTRVAAPRTADHPQCRGWFSRRTFRTPGATLATTLDGGRFHRGRPRRSRSQDHFFPRWIERWWSPPPVRRWRKPASH